MESKEEEMMNMDYSNDETKITLRMCDLNSVLAIMVLGNKDTLNSGWDSINMLAKNIKK